MWYREAKKFNMFGLPISGDKKFKLFAEEDEDESTAEETPLEISSQQPEDIENLSEPEIEDETPEDVFTPEDLQNNIQKIESDPTALIQLPPLHDRCHCYIETRPILSIPGIQDGKRVWLKSENCCSKCEQTAQQFNAAEVQRLLNKGIDVNRIS